jgi:signal transduction histidine kinase
VRPTRLFRTAAFRLAIAYAVLFGGAVAVLFAVVYWATTSFAEAQMRAAISAEVAALANDGSRDPTRLARAIDARLGSTGHRGFDYLLLDPQGRRLAGNMIVTPPAAGWSTVSPPKSEAGGEDEPDSATIAFGVVLPGGGRFFVGQGTGSLADLRELVAEAFAWAGAVTVGLALLGGLLMSGVFLRRVEAVNRAAARIVAGDLANRIPERGGEDEFDRLARNLNRMLDRIAQLMDGLRQVSSDIAHDLRTPLARLRQGLERARLKARSVEDYEAAVDRAIAETDAILATFGALLRIAQLEAGVKRSGFARVDLSDVFGRIAEAYEAVAEDEGKILVSTIEPGLATQGDRELQTQMIANLVENAIRHTPAGTRIALAAAAGPRGPVGTVADTGPGIPEAARGQVFQRFYRLERSRTTPGSGLGLSLVAAIADLHGIAVSLDDNRPGLRVTLDFAAETVAGSNRRAGRITPP